MFFQQGDVLIRSIDNVTGFTGLLDASAGICEARKLGNKLDHKVLAYGEATGHCHQITQGDVELYENNGVLYLKVISNNAIVEHQEHLPLTLPAGDYVVEKVKEYDHFLEESRNVRD